jgi:hypothetical protein
VREKLPHFRDRLGNKFPRYRGIRQSSKLQKRNSSKLGFFSHLSLFLITRGTKNVPWHILAPAAVACDIYLIRRSAHPRGAFFSLQESNFL